jgi:hypothetical protein
MTNESVTNRDLYNAINDLRKEVCERVEKIEVKTVEIDNWRNRVVGQFSVIMIIVGAGINYLWDNIFKK